MNEEQIDKAISQMIRYAESNQLILTMIKEIQNDIRDIKTQLKIMELIPEIQEIADNFIPDILSEAEKIEAEE